MRRRMMMKVEPVQQAEGNRFALYIYDDVSAYGRFDWDSWTYLDSETSAEYFRQQLGQIPDNAVIDLYINSYGGSVKEGTAIYNQLKRHPAQKNGYVDGMAYSVAFLILQACDRRIMNLGTTCLAHNMLMDVYGNAEQLRKAAEDLDNMMVSNRQVFLKRSGGKITEEQLIEIMEQEKILTPDECLQYGFVDEVSDKLVEQPKGDDPDQKANPLMQLMGEYQKNMQQQFSQLRETCEAIQKAVKKEPQEVTPIEKEKPGNEDKQNNICQSFFNALSN